MIMQVKFTENEQSFKANFGEVNKVSDGGYDKGYESGYTDGYNIGFDEAYDYAYVDAYEDATSKDSPFYYLDKLDSIWADMNFPQPTDLVIRLYHQPTKGCMNTFLRATNINSIKFRVDNIDGAWDFNQTFRECDVKIVDLTECSREIKNIHYMFFQAHKLESILGALDLTNCTTTGAGVTYGFFADSLKDVEFIPNSIYVPLRFTSKVLTQASIESIINGLADLTNNTTRTLTLNYEVGKTLTESQKARIAAKNWTLAY